MDPDQWQGEQGTEDGGGCCSEKRGNISIHTVELQEEKAERAQALTVAVASSTMSHSVKRKPTTAPIMTTRSVRDIEGGAGASTKAHTLM
jgi:hypothetical protein